SKFNLDRIADDIDVILNSRNSQEVDSVKQLDQKKKETVKTETAKPKTVDEQTKNASPSHKAISNENSKVKDELNGSSITIAQLMEYKKNSSQFKSSIQLYLDFWDKVKKSNQKNDFDQLLNKVKKDGNLENSDLEKFLKGICANSDAFEKFRDASG